MLTVRWAPVTGNGLIPPLGEELQKHIDGYKNPAARCASASAWSLLYEMLREEGIETDAVSFGAHGKPFFLSNRVFFSLSHSRGVCAAALSDRPVGVDVERCRPFFRPKLVEKSLSEEEKAVFDGDFTRIWCRKESVAKLTGEGITGYPDRIDTLSPLYSFTEEKVELDGCAYWLVTAEMKFDQENREEKEDEKDK